MHVHRQGNGLRCVSSALLAARSAVCLSCKADMPSLIREIAGIRKLQTVARLLALIRSTDASCCATYCAKNRTFAIASRLSRAKIKCSICSSQFNTWDAQHSWALVLIVCLSRGRRSKARFVAPTGCPGIAVPPGSAHTHHRWVSFNFATQSTIICLFTYNGGPMLPRNSTKFDQECCVASEVILRQNMDQTLK